MYFFSFDSTIRSIKNYIYFLVNIIYNLNIEFIFLITLGNGQFQTYRTTPTYLK